MGKNKKSNLECGSMKANAMDIATNCGNVATDCGDGGCCCGDKKGNKKK